MKLFKNGLFFIVVLIVSLFLFYKFMTYDRNYTWTKEYPYEIAILADSLNLNVEKIKLPTERKVKIKLQKFLNKFDLMPYGKEFGEQITLKSENENLKVICKSWCLSDHLIGLEIEYKNIGKQELSELRKQFENKFPNYKLIWTKTN